MTTKPIPPRQAESTLTGVRLLDALQRANVIYDRAVDDLGEVEVAPRVRDLLLDNMTDLSSAEVDELIERSYLGQRRKEFTMYGCSRQEIDDALKFGEEWASDELAVAASMLSDTQEVMALENRTPEARLESARQMINRVKYILFTKVRPKMKEEGDV